MCEACDRDNTPKSEEPVIMRKVSDILRNVKYSVDMDNMDNPSDWFRMMAEKSQDDSFGRLVHVIPKDGFLDPIRISENPDGSWELGNGHHRLTAAILLGLDEVPTLQEKWDLRQMAHSYDLYETDADRDTCDMVSESLRNDMSEQYDKEAKELQNA